MSRFISVVIPTYNSAAFVVSAVESVLRQELEPAEIIVVDDGSTDDTARVLGPYRRSIRYITQPNSGPAVARNRGVGAAQSDWIAFLDADDVWMPHKLRRQLECMKENPRAGLIHSAFLDWDNRTGETSRRCLLRHDFSGRCYPMFFFQNGVLPSTALVRKEYVTRIGGFDETIRKAGVEDYDFSFRIARHCELAYIEEPLVLYRRHEGNASDQVLHMREGELNVLKKILRDDPELRKLLTNEQYHERMHDLLSHVGYRYHDKGLSAQARNCFLQAGCHRPGDLYIWLLFLANVFPARWIRVLRKLKSKIRTRKLSLRRCNVEAEPLSDDLRSTRSRGASPESESPSRLYAVEQFDQT